MVSRRVKLMLLVAAVVLIVAECKKKKKEAPPPPLLTQDFAAIGNAIVAWVTQKKIYLNLALFACPLLFAPEHKGDFLAEMVGTIVMVFLTFSPGPFSGAFGLARDGDFQPVEWALHLLGVMIADYTCGGPHVNPGVTTAMWVWNKLKFKQAFVHYCGQLAGGVIAFPALNGLGEYYGAKIGGPEFVLGGKFSLGEGVFNEFVGTFCLLSLVFLLCTTW